MSLAGGWTACQAQAQRTWIAQDFVNEIAMHHQSIFLLAKGVLRRHYRTHSCANLLRCLEWRLAGMSRIPQALRSSRRTASAELPTLATAAASSFLLHPSVVVQ